MGMIGLARNLAKAGLGIVEGDMIKVGGSLLRAGGHAVSTVVGVTISHEIKERIDEALAAVDEVDE